MTRLRYSNYLTIKLFILFLCVGFCLSCGSDEDALKTDSQANAQINRVNQILATSKKLKQEDIDAIKKLYEQYPNSATARKTLQTAYINREDWGALESLFGKIPNSEMTNEDRINLPKVYIKLGRYEDAVETAKSSDTENKQEMDGILANAYFHLGRYEEAKNLIDGSWENVLKTKDIDQILIRGMIHFHQGENEKAIGVLEKGLAIDAESVPLSNSLARIYAAQGKTEQAKEYALKVEILTDKMTADEQQKTKFVDQANKIKEAYQAKRFEEVITLVNQALPIADDKNKQALYQYLYVSYQALGKTKEAQDVLVRAKR